LAFVLNGVCGLGDEELPNDKDNRGDQQGENRDRKRDQDRWHFVAFDSLLILRGIVEMAIHVYNLDASAKHKIRWIIFYSGES
jgi:hypothetical protein